MTHAHCYEGAFVSFMNFGTQDPMGLPHVLSKKQAMKDSGLLRSFLGPALGVTNTHRLYSIRQVLEGAESIESIKSIESVESVESIESIESVESVE
jgi:hypothetical protein